MKTMGTWTLSVAAAALLSGIQPARAREEQAAGAAASVGDEPAAQAAGEGDKH